MKSLITYILIFTIVFLIVTVGIYILNSKYNNVFKLDFSPPQDSLAVKTDSLSALNDSLAVEKIDSVKILKHYSDSLLTELNNVKAELNSVKTKLSKKDEQIERIKKTEKTRRDSSYKAWLKTTKKLYETMDTRKAAKLLSSISDNEARDILYSMNKKKAAQILAVLTTDKVKKLTRPR